MDILRRLESGDIGGRDPDGPGGGGSRDSRIGEAAKSATTRLMASSEPLGEAFDLWRRKFQDRMLPLERSQARLEMMNGVALPQNQDVRAGEEGLVNKTGARLSNFADNILEPLIATMEANGVSKEELGQYLYARHAPERNARISSINDKFDEGEGSGMSDAEASGILARFDVEGRIPALERAAEKYDAINAFRQKTLVEGNLLSQEVADAWSETYQFYAPLRGYEDASPEDADPDRARSGPGISVRGPESRRAFGRKSKAADIIEYTILQAQEAIIRAEKNEVDIRLYNLVQANPDPEIWTTQTVTRKPYWNEKTGTVSYRNDNSISAADAPYTISLKIDGRERRVTFNSKNKEARRFAAAMKMAGSSDLGPLRYLAAYNRFMSAINTRFMPTFVVTNALRDIESAAYNLNAEGRGDIARGAAADYRKAFGAAMRGAFKDGLAGRLKRTEKTKEWDQWYDDFLADGGKTAFNQLDDIETIKRRINNRLALPSGTVGQATFKAKAVVGSAISLVENMNDGVENGVRLAVYKSARENGLSREQAASMARNVTVNFTKRGEWSTVINSLYLFYNASIQGSARTLKSLSYSRGRKIAGGIAVASLLLDLLNAMVLSDDDEDGESFYDKIPAYEKSRNLIIMVPGVKEPYVKIPLGFGLNIFPAIGRSVGEIMRGKDWSTAAGETLGTIIDAFNPLGGSSNILNFLAPTIADPFVDLSLNRNFADKPIYQEGNPFSPERSDSSSAFPSTAPFWRTSAAQLNALSGGDEVLPGAIDIHPETIKYAFGTATGGAGRFLIDTMIDLPSKVLGKEEIDANDIPFVSKVLGKKPQWYDKASFYARAEQIEQIAERPKLYAELGRYDKADAYALENEAALSLRPVLKATQKELRSIRRARADIEGALFRNEMTDDEARTEREALKKAEDAAILEFNRQYVAVIANPKRP